MSELVQILLLSFVCFRISELLVFDLGPFSIFMKLRKFFALSANKIPVFFELVELFNCPYCMGIWISFFLTLFLLPLSLRDFFVYWLAIAGIQSFLQSIVVKRASNLESE